MQRLTTIAIDGQPASPPEQWSADWVQCRLIEAYSVERRLPQLRRRAIAGAWPATVVEWEDILGRASEVRQQVLQSWEYSNSGVSAAELTRTEQAHDWLRVILAPHPTERLCLAHWATAIAYGRSVRSLLKRRRWSRSTFYRYVTAGARHRAGIAAARASPWYELIRRNAGSCWPINHFVIKHPIYKVWHVVDNKGCCWVFH
jgi:hypothetical protein